MNLQKKGCIIQKGSLFVLKTYRNGIKGIFFEQAKKELVLLDRYFGDIVGDTEQPPFGSYLVQPSQ